MSRNKMRKPPGGGSQRHAKLGKRGGVEKSDGSKQADAAIDKTKEVLKSPPMKKPEKAKPKPKQDSKANKSGYQENMDTT